MINNFKKNKKPKEDTQILVPSSFRYKKFLYGYCFLCNDFGHKRVDSRTYGVRSRNQISKRYEHFPTLVGHIRCYVCETVGHKAKDCKIPMFFMQSNKRNKFMQSLLVKKPNMNVHAKDESHKIWRRKEQQEFPLKIEACMASGGAYGCAIIACR